MFGRDYCYIKQLFKVAGAARAKEEEKYRSTRAPKYAYRMKTKRRICLKFYTVILEIVIYRNKQQKKN